MHVSAKTFAASDPSRAPLLLPDRKHVPKALTKSQPPGSRARGGRADTTPKIHMPSWDAGPGGNEKARQPASCCSEILEQLALFQRVKIKVKSQGKIVGPIQTGWEKSGRQRSRISQCRQQQSESG